MHKLKWTRTLILLILFKFPSISLSQNETLISEFISKLTLKNQENFKKLNGKIKIEYIEINRDSLNQPSLIKHSFLGKENCYFYPASLVKWPVILLSLEKLNHLESLGVNRLTRFSIKNIGKCNYYMEEELSIPEGRFSLANNMRKILLTSDNNSYNILYDFLGYEYIYSGLTSKGYKNVFITRKFTGCNLEENRVSKPFWFYDANGDVIYHQPAVEYNGEIKLYEGNNALVGKAYLDNKRLVNEPKSFTETNYLDPQDALDMHVRFFFPELFAEHNRWQIKDEDRKFLIKYLSMLPKESPYLEYQDSVRYPDNYKKLLIFGDDNENNNPLHKTVKVFNIIGYSYGFMSDIAYIVDLENHIDFFLAISMYANENDVLDGNYNYTDISLPLFSELGKIILDYERNKERLFYPDFSEITDIISP